MSPLGVGRPPRPVWCQLPGGLGEAVVDVEGELERGEGAGGFEQRAYRLGQAQRVGHETRGNSESPEKRVSGDLAKLKSARERHGFGVVRQLDYRLGRKGHSAEPRRNVV